MLTLKKDASEDLIDELLPTGEGGSDAVQCIAGLLANERVRVFQGVYQSAWNLWRGVVLQVIGVARGHERAYYGRANRRAQRTDELRS